MGLIRRNNPETPEQKENRRVRRRGIKATIYTLFVTVAVPVITQKTGFPLGQILGLG